MLAFCALFRVQRTLSVCTPFKIPWDIEQVVLRRLTVNGVCVCARAGSSPFRLHCSEEFVAKALLDTVSAVFWWVAEKPSAEANCEGYLIEKYCFRVLSE